jgi:tetratricopeptide (TPR) repeat protein
MNAIYPVCMLLILVGPIASFRGEGRIAAVPSARVIMALLMLSLGVLMLSPGASVGDPSLPAVEERRQPSALTDAENEYNRGVRARVAKDWPGAADAFRRAIQSRAAFPEAWNELGYALRNQGRYAEALAAYDEALRLRPNFPEALEYLGEAYVKVGRIEDARRVLERLRPLDPARAQELTEAIETGK